MLKIIVHNNKAFIYSIEDWEIMRKECRIIGFIFGTQKCFPSLPVQLLPEEVFVLLKEKKASLVEEYEDATKDFNLESFYQQLFEQEQVIYRNVKRKETQMYLKQIAKGKNDNRSEEQILEDELSRVCQLKIENMVWPLLLNENSTYKELTSCDILNIDQEKAQIFHDLWKRGFFITSGHKFGADFLVYKGDPILYHASYTVLCLQNGLKENLSCSEFVTFVRLSNAVKKQAILATCINNYVKYVTINWFDD